MELIIDLDTINDPGKKEWLLHTLKLMGIDFQATEKPQTIEEYYDDLEQGAAEIERGEYITMEDLRIEARKMVTVWSKQAKRELPKAYLYILIESLQNA